MAGYKIVNLKDIIDELGENKGREIILDFSCPLNFDVENFLKEKAIEFAKQQLSQTHLVFSENKNKIVLVGYFTLAIKSINVDGNALSKNLRKRMAKFCRYDSSLKSYVISAPLIAQLGKNFSNDYNELIKGDELLKMACEKIKDIQKIAGGKIAYLECEDVEKLKYFYSSNGFVEFGKRQLDKDEVNDLKGKYLIQMLKYFSG